MHAENLAEKQEQRGGEEGPGYIVASTIRQEKKRKGGSDHCNESKGRKVRVRSSGF